MEGTDMDNSDVMKAILQDGDVIKCGDNLIFNPFNSENSEITLSDVQSILNRYGIKAPVHNLELYREIYGECEQDTHIRRPHPRWRRPDS